MSPRPDAPRPPAARVRVAALLVCTAALGLASRRVSLGVRLWDKSLGDALYATAMALLFALAQPRRAPLALGLAGFAASLGVELFQLTHIPLRLAARHRWVAWVLGTVFSWHDVACYALGAALAALMLRAALRGA